MARDLHENLPEARELFSEAKRILGFDLASVCFNGPEEELKQTRITQPAIFVHSAVMTEVARSKNIQPAVTAGHSLGEYSALFAAAALNFEDALKLVKIRSELMQQAGEMEPGTMAAVIGLKAEQVMRICDRASASGVVQVANFNSPIQVVISGTINGVNTAMQMAKEQGAKRAIPLVVGGAFHSPLMEYAMDGLAQALDSVDIKEASVPIYSNVYAKPVTNPDEIRSCLKRQLTSPVRWMEIIENMVSDGATEFHEIGPGNILTGLLKRISKQASGRIFGTFEHVGMLDEVAI